jgi:hypothetical protein
MNHDFLTTFCRIILGHYFNNQHLFRINMGTSPLCACGSDEASIDLFIFACNLCEEISRASLMCKLRQKGVIFPVNICHLLPLNRLDILDIIYKLAVTRLASPVGIME